MDLFKRFVFEQAFIRYIRTVTGGEQTETVQCSWNTNRFESRFSAASIRSVLNHLGLVSILRRQLLRPVTM